MPQHTHDCDKCEFLGTYEPPLARLGDPERITDLYFCPRCDGGSVIARFASGPSAYMSIPLGVLLYAGYLPEHPLVEAARRQIRKWASKGA